MQDQPDPLSGIDNDSGKTSLPSIKKRRGFWFWLKTHRTRSLVAVGIVIIGIGTSAAWWVYSATKPAETQLTPIAATKRVEKYYSPLTGEEVSSQADTKLPITAIMIENSPGARPQSGLKQAGVVFEAIAEAGITRYAVLYQSSQPNLVGPVRSLRPYFLDWITPFNAAIAHVGGSALALSRVRDGSYRDMDQFFNSSTYWRAADRAAPHNVYTNFTKLSALESAKDYTSSTFTAWERADGQVVDKPDATTIKINFSSSTYNTYYKYDASTNTYSRYLGGVAHLDREKGQITPSVVIAMIVKESTIMEDGYRENITTTGSGKAYIFQNGTVTQATWRKKSVKDQLEWLDGSGNEITLNRGQTWIAAVPDGKGSVSW